MEQTVLGFETISGKSYLEILGFDTPWKKFSCNSTLIRYFIYYMLTESYPKIKYYSSENCCVLLNPSLSTHPNRYRSMLSTYFTYRFVLNRTAFTTGCSFMRATQKLSFGNLPFGRMSTPLARSSNSSKRSNHGQMW